jgi:hypothetical protein
MEFKKIIFSNGSEEWAYDLKEWHSSKGDAERDISPEVLDRLSR